jgi:hypothetical protein
MTKPSYTLLDDFELKGIWWLPEKPDLQISGILSFESEKRISLELLGSFQRVGQVPCAPDEQLNASAMFWEWIISAF